MCTLLTAVPGSIVLEMLCRRRSRPFMYTYHSSFRDAIEEEQQQVHGEHTLQITVKISYVNYVLIPNQVWRKFTRAGSFFTFHQNYIHGGTYILHNLRHR